MQNRFCMNAEERGYESFVWKSKNCLCNQLIIISLLKGLFNGIKALVYCQLRAHLMALKRLFVENGKCLMSNLETEDGFIG